MLILEWMIKVFVGTSMLMSFLVACSPVNFEKSTNNCGGLGESYCVVNTTDPTFIDYSYPYTGVVPKVDILIVNDSSKSMEADQRNMADNFGSFLNEISSLDWQLAITTMDISNNYRALSTDEDIKNPTSYTYAEYKYLENYQDGNFIPFSDGNKVLKSSDSNALTKFNKAIQIEKKYFAQSGDERGILSASLAIERNKNQLIRDDSHLAIIFLSDEDVRSKGDSNTDSRKKPFDKDRAAHLKSVIVKQLGPKKAVSVYPIIVPSVNSTSCLNAQKEQIGYGSVAYVGYMYEDLLQYFQGAVGSICASNYGSLLAEIGLDLEQRTKEVINLVCVPAEDEDHKLEVLGLPNGYTIDLNGSELTISPVLQPGETVTLSYSCK